MLVGYARVSTRDQAPALQLDALRAAGCERIYTETASGAQRERPELAAALDFLRPGDTLAVWRLDRLARSLRQLIATVERLEAGGRAALADRGHRHHHLRRPAGLPHLRRPGRVRAPGHRRADAGRARGGAGARPQGRAATLARRGRPAGGTGAAARSRHQRGRGGAAAEGRPGHALPPPARRAERHRRRLSLRSSRRPAQLGLLPPPLVPIGRRRLGRRCRRSAGAANRFRSRPGRLPPGRGQDLGRPALQEVDRACRSAASASFVSREAASSRSRWSISQRSLSSRAR